MKYELIDPMEQFLETAYPRLPLVAKVIEEALGISLEDMRSTSRNFPLVVARSIFSYICDEYPALIVSSYINRSHNIVIKNRNDMRWFLDTKCGHAAYRVAYDKVINKLNNVEKVD